MKQNLKNILPLSGTIIGAIAVPLIWFFDFSFINTLLVVHLTVGVIAQLAISGALRISTPFRITVAFATTIGLLLLSFFNASVTPQYSLASLFFVLVYQTMGEVSGLLTRAERAMVIANAVAASLGVLGFFVPIIDYSFQPILLWVITFSGLATGVLSLVYRSILIQALSDEKRTAVRDLSWFTTLINLIAHNIRTPLANISIRKDIALLKLAQGEAENVREDLEDMEKSLQTTSEILERFLKVSALSKSTHVRNVMDMGGFLNEYPSLKVRNNGVLYLTQSEKISLTLALEVFVDNALKYADSDVVVTISANGIVVRDFGSGIPDLEKGITEQKTYINKDGKLHGMGIAFSMKILEAVGWRCELVNHTPGLEVRMSPAG